MEAVPVVRWLVVLFALGVLARPLSARLFAEDDHAFFALPIALASLGVVTHLVGHLAFGLPAAIVGVLVLLWVSLRFGKTDTDWRPLGEAALVFTGAFALIIAIRSVDPAAAPLPLAIGEKFLDFGILASLERSATLPPEDMWFAGEAVRYYYGGHLVVSVLGTLAGTPPALSYNLGLATFYAALVTGAYGLAGMIVRPYRVSRRVAATLGAFFVGIAGNLEPTGKLLLWLAPDALASWAGRTFGLEEHIVSWAPRDFGYFDASRVLPVDPSDPETYEAATEFPLFGWLNGDLHAHMLSQVFMILVAALLVAYWQTPAENRRRRLALLLGVLPPVAGFVGVANVWSFPTVGGLTLVAVLFAPADPPTLVPAGGRRWLRARLDFREWWLTAELRRLLRAGVLAVVVLGFGIVWTLPFWTGVVPGGPGKTLTLWQPWTPLGPLVLVHGAFLAAFAVALGRRAGVVVGPLPVWVGGSATVALFALLGMPALGLVIPLVAGGWWLLRTRTDAGFELALVVAGAGIVLLVELLTVEGERFNVIFKAYNHVWLFWAVAGGVLLARLSAGWPAGVLDIDRPRWRVTGTLLTVVLVVSTGVYAGLALPEHVETGSPTADAEGPTLDATAYLEVEYPEEAPAIRWLDDRAGQPTIVTAAPGGYWWRSADGDGASAPASLTGLPSVLGWFHEEQYRGSAVYDRRVDHVRDIYAGGATRQLELLDRYEVRYVYVGPAERATYGRISIGDLQVVSVANSWENVTIYEVNQTALQRRLPALLDDRD